MLEKKGLRLMQNKGDDLAVYRINTAFEMLDAAKICMETKHYKDAINRSYYASFYAVRAVLAIEGMKAQILKGIKML